MTLASQRPRRGFPRLRAWYSKMLYLLVALGLWYFVSALLPTQLTEGIVRSTVVLIAVALATRIFRSKGETNEPRAWWRATGQPTAGFVLGVLFSLCAVALLINAYGVEQDEKYLLYPGQDVDDVYTGVIFIALAVFYFTSSVRLRGMIREERLEADRKRERK